MTIHFDEKRANLRRLVGTVEAAIAAGDPGRLDEAWRALVAALDLGPEPDVRACPRCGAIGMRTASRCGHCWSALAPA